MIRSINGGDATGSPLNVVTGTTPKTLCVMKMPWQLFSTPGLTMRSAMLSPSVSQISKTTARVTPGKMPHATGTVQTSPRLIQN